MPEEQLSLNLADEICQLYAGFTGEALSLLKTAVAIGEKLKIADDTPGFDFGSLPFGEDQAQVFRTFHDRRDEITEQLMLKLISLPALRPRDPLLSGPAIVWAEWYQPINRFYQWVRKREAEFPVEEWPQMHKDALRDRLKPLVELYRQL